jgi:hypothetical protein
MSLSTTTDRNDPNLQKIRPDGMQESYLVLSDEERAKGFVRPIRMVYLHVGKRPVINGRVLIRPGEGACGTSTRIGREIAESYARSPEFYTGTFCCSCGKHFPLKNPDGSPGFLWESDMAPVGS